MIFHLLLKKKVLGNRHRNLIVVGLLLSNPIIWKIPTHILYGEKDNLTAYGTIFEFAQRTHSTLSVMRNGEHWFHTEEQMKFLDEWIVENSKHNDRFSRATCVR